MGPPVLLDLLIRNYVDQCSLCSFMGVQYTIFTMLTNSVTQLKGLTVRSTRFNASTLWQPLKSSWLRILKKIAEAHLSNDGLHLWKQCRATAPTLIKSKYSSESSWCTHYCDIVPRSISANAVLTLWEWLQHRAGVALRDTGDGHKGGEDHLESKIMVLYY